MQAILFNSGTGKRMGEFTADHHKSMAQLSNGETLLERQLRLLQEQGITRVVITTGAFAEQLHQKAALPAFAGMTIRFVANPLYATTNYIYSMYLAREAVSSEQDVLLLHGDLAWNRRLLEKFLAQPSSDLVMVNRRLPCPSKDFKARLQDGKVQEVSVTMAGEDCYPLQPLYRLTPATWKGWCRAVAEFVEQGRCDVYAEEALNTLLPDLQLMPFSYDEDFIDEVDTLEDLARVSAALRRFDFAEQRLLIGEQAHRQMGDVLKQYGTQRLLVVAGKSFATSPVRAYLSTLSCQITHFGGFSPNPTYEEVVAGVDLFRREQCDAILSVGGGSAMDVAKAIKLFAPMTLKTGETHLQQTPQYWHLPHFAVATTAGTGSESTRYSVLYHHGVKQSIVHDSIFPEVAVLDPILLQTLSDYQKKCTLLDALCQCIEAIWSIHATPESTAYAGQGIGLILQHAQAYLSGDTAAAQAVLRAANASGQAINITQTTAAHAMSYELGGMCDLPHGYAVALCLPLLFDHMIGQIDHAKHPERSRQALDAIATAFDATDWRQALEQFEALFASLELEPPRAIHKAELEQLVQAVNPTRLANHPIALTPDEIRTMYRAMLRVV